MTRGLNSSTESFLTSMAAIQERLEKAQRQIASGRKLEAASDEPDQVAGLLQTRAEIGRVVQLRANLGRTKAEVDGAEQALQLAVTLTDRALVLGAQGATGTQTATTRQSLAGELESILSQLVGLSNMEVDGRYLFSGDADQNQPYSFDPEADPPYGSYEGAPATRKALHPGGTQFAVSHTAQQIFDNEDPARNLFSAINALRAGLAADDSDAISSAMASLKSSSEHLNSELAFYGAVQNQVAGAIETAHKSELQLRTKLSEIEDADLTAAILELNQARYQQEAALAARGRMPQTSLFDYLR